MVFEDAVKAQDQGSIIGSLQVLIEKSARKEKIEWLKVLYYTFERLAWHDEGLKVVN
jgi:hypothetical protein